MIRSKVFPLLAAVAAGLAAPSRAQSCAMPAEAEFKVVPVIPARTMANPSHMTVLPNGEIFAVEQWTGKVWHYVPGKAAAEAGIVPTDAGLKVEDGMLGIAADLDYAKTRWLYIYHTPAVMGSTRITRYTVADGKLASPKIIITLPRTRVGGGHDERHAGGGMDWNPRTGDLYLSVGDDTYPFGDRSVYGPRDPDNAYSNALRTSANTNDLRGKVLRIRPIPFADTETPAAGAGTTYTIPAGNLYPPGTAKARPEIYAMGLRNPYRVKADPVTGWAYTGEVGADASDFDAAKGPAGHDHVYLMKGPANFGWPFNNGNMQPYIVRDFEKDYIAAGMKAGQPFDQASLKNRSAFNTGLVDLPPAAPPLIWYCANGSQTGLSAKLGGGSETAIIGPVYDFNPALNSAVKLPPWFHRKVIFGDYSRHYLWLMTVDAAGALTALERIKTNVDMTDLHLGPDGTLYLLDYNGGGVNALQYTGAQKDHKACAFIKEGCMDPKFSEYDKAANLQPAGACRTSVALARGARPARFAPGWAAAGRRIALPPGALGLDAFAVDGRKVASILAPGQAAVELPAAAGEGMLWVRFRGE